MSQSLPLVIKHRSWPHLLRDLQRRPGLNLLARLPRAQLQARMIAPVSLAYGLSRYAPNLLDRSLLRVLVVGAEIHDAFDNGRWFGLLPALFDRSMEIEVTLVGPTLGSPHILTTPKIDFLPAVTASVHKTTLAQYQQVRPDSQFDVVALFHPGFESHQEWLSDGSLASCLASQAFIFGTGYAYDEIVADEALLNAFGFSFAQPTGPNPFGLDLNPGIHKPFEAVWASWLWSLSSDSAVLSPDFKPDRDRVSEINSVSSMFAHLATTTHGFVPANVGTVRSIDNRTVLYVFDQLQICLDSAEVLFLNETGQLVDSKLVADAEMLTAYPGEDAPQMDRWIWGMYIFASLVEAIGDPTELANQA